MVDIDSALSAPVGISLQDPNIYPTRLARLGFGMSVETTMAATPSLGLEHEVNDDAKDSRDYV